MSLTFDEARHFLSRTAFGGTPEEIRRVMQLDRAAAVAQALAIPTNKAQTTPPAWIHRLPPLPKVRKHWGEAQRKTFREGLKADEQELKAWWYRELLTSLCPLLERMTLWWHNHFTSSLHKVKWPPFLYQQNVLLRLYALGSFRTLLTTIARNPAMLLYLDTQSNRKEHPNENFARELFERFTLGEGHYTEQDIKEAARAFTGWHLDCHTGAFRVDLLSTAALEDAVGGHNRASQNGPPRYHGILFRPLGFECGLLSFHFSELLFRRKVFCRESLVHLVQ